MYTQETFKGIKKITEKEEIDLCCKIPSKEIINIFTIIYIILDENYLQIPTANLIINLSQIIMPKLNVGSISKLIFNKILLFIESLLLKILPNKIKLNPSQILKISHIKRENPELFDNTKGCLNDLEKRICIALEEFYNFVNAEFPDGTSLFEVNIAIDKMNKIQKKINRLKSKSNLIN